MRSDIPCRSFVVLDRRGHPLTLSRLAGIGAESGGSGCHCGIRDGRQTEISLDIRQAVGIVEAQHRLGRE
jgi:hypothetical protein